MNGSRDGAFVQDPAEPMKHDADFRSLIENLPVLFYIVDVRPPFSPRYVSPAFSRFGYPLEMWTNDPDIWLKVIHPDDLDWVFEQTAASTASSKDADYEYRIFDSNGDLVWVRDRGCLIHDQDGKLLFREGVMIDVTLRKQAEQSVAESEQRYRSLFENANDIIYVHDLKGRYLSLNSAAEHVFGYTRDEALSLHMSEVVAPEHLDLARRMFRQKMEGTSDQTTYELDCITKQGSRVTLEINSTVLTLDGEPVAIQGIARDVTERRHAEEALRESEKRYRRIFENANDIIYTHDLDGNFTSLNHTGELITGYTRDEAMQMTLFDLIAPESLQVAIEMTSKGLDEERPTRYEIDVVAKDGRRIPLEISTRLIMKRGIPVGVQGIGRDITDRRRAEEALRASELKFRQLGEGIYHQVWTAKANGDLDYVNQRTVEYFDKPHEEIIGSGWKGLIHPDDLDNCLRRWNDSLTTGIYYEVEFRLRRHDGTYRWHKARANPGRNADGMIVRWFGTNTDIDDQKQTEDKLNYLARHDALTGLPNRSELMTHLRGAISRAERSASSRFALLFLDLDRFKVINDSLGHMVGDKLLKAISEKLDVMVRPGDIVARLGGDEFVILLNRTGGREEVVKVADRIQRNIEKPFNIDGYEIFTSASIGIILSDNVRREPEEFLRDADSAMYRAKESGKARYEVFDAEMYVNSVNLLETETDLRKAVERNDFVVLFQPIVDLTDGTVTEFEALIRWKHAERGLIAPDDFIGVAEETGLIVPIGRWMLSQACENIARWQKKSVRRLSVSVNLSAKQLMHPSLIDDIRNVISETGIEPFQLKLEVTESVVMEQSERSLRVLRELDRIGVSLATDDFGTGYSSLSYLARFPFDRLKIDRSFIDKMVIDGKSSAIVKTILTLGENLGMDVVAEGIESEEQLRRLQLFGCRLGQGFLFSEPVAADVAPKTLGKPAAPLFQESMHSDIGAGHDILELDNLQ